MLSVYSKDEIIKAYLEKKHADFDDKLDEIIIITDESAHDEKLRKLVEKDYAEELGAIGLTVDDYFDELDSEDLTAEDYTPVEYLEENLERFPSNPKNLSKEEYEKIIPTNIFYNRYCSNFEADFDKGNMHGLGVKLDIDDVTPMYDFDSTACADENIENVVKYNTKSLNKVMRKLGHKEFPEAAKVETKINIRCFDDIDTDDIVLDDIGADVANSGKQFFEDAGNGKVKVITKLHGASYQEGFVTGADFKERKTLIYFDAEFESTLELDQKIVDEILEMQDVSMFDFERRTR